MNVQSVTPVLNVADVPASLAWFEGLGWRRTFTWNDAGHIEAAGDRNDGGDANFAGLCAGDGELFLCRDGQGARGDGRGTWMSWWLCTAEEVHAAHALAVEHGVEVLQSPTEEPWGCLECLLRHPDGHTFRVSTNLNA